MRSKRAIKNIITTVLMNIISIICGFIVPKLIIESYGSNVNGLINSITQFLGYISLLEVGIGPIIISSLYKPIAKKDKNEIEEILISAQKFFSRIGIIFVIYLLILIVVYPGLVNQNFDRIYTISLILIISISTFFEYFVGIVYRLFLESSQKKYICNFINIITTLLNSAMIVILIKFDFSVHVVKFISALIFIARPLFLNIYVKKNYSVKIARKDTEYVIKNKKDGFSLHIAGIIFSRADVAILTLFSDLKYVSIYSVYNLITTGINNLSTSFSAGIGATFGDMIAKKENDNLIKKFRIFETLYISVIAVIVSCMICLIIPFISVYTSKMVDANYIQPLFSIILCIGTFFYLSKVPYETLSYASGRFKEIKLGGWIEAALNVVFSLILVFKYNLVGVAIGTAISVLFRMCELIIFANKKILNTNLKATIKKILNAIFIISVNVIIYNMLISKLIIVSNFIEFLIVAIIIGIISLITVIIVLLIASKEEFNYIKNILVGVIKK